MAHTEIGFIIMSAVKVSEGENGLWKTNLVYRAEIGIALERHDEAKEEPDVFPISLEELRGLAPAAAELWSQLESADVPPVSVKTPSRPGSKASPAPGNSPSSSQRGRKQ